MKSEIRVLCCSCGCQRTDELWHEPKPEPSDTLIRISHTYCPDCLEQAMAEMEAEFTALPKAG